VYTESEWNILAYTAERMPIFGIISSLLLLLFLIFAKEVFNSYLIVLYAILSLIASAVSVRLNMSGSNLQSRVCVDEAIYIAQEQPENKDSLCVQQGATLTYTFQAISACMAMLALQFALRVSKSPSSLAASRSRWLTAIECFVILVLPAITTGIAGSEKLFGYSKTRSVCFVRSYPYGNKDMDMALVVLPVLIYSAFGFMCVVVGLIVSWMNVNSSSPTVNNESLGDVEAVAIPSNTDQKVMDEKPIEVPSEAAATISASPTIFEADAPWVLLPADGTGETALYAWLITLFVSLVFILPFLLRSGVQYQLYDSYLNAFRDWTQCVFENYDGVTDSSFISVCGAHVSKRPTYAVERMNPFVLTANSIAIFPTFVVSYLMIYFWRNTLGSKTFPNGTNNGYQHTRVVIVQQPTDPEQNVVAAPVSDVEL
jgi:hypothetical protein